jgi:YfiH family protein
VFAYQDRRGPVEVAFTDRGVPTSGGPASVSPGSGIPGSGPGDLDLGEPRSAGAAREAEQRRLGENLAVVVRAFSGEHETGTGTTAAGIGTAAPVPVVRLHQVHGAHVHHADRGWLAGAGEPPQADGVVTDLPGVVLLVRAADCLPVLLADAERGLVAAAHAGRAGLVAGVLPATVGRLRDLGAERVVAWVGPHICGRCYEVPAAMRDEVAAAVPEAFAETAWGTPAVDIGAGARAQLRAAGVSVVDAARCTREHSDLPSHRRDGAAAGRLGGLVWVRP